MSTTKDEEGWFNKDSKLRGEIIAYFGEDNVYFPSAKTVVLHFPEIQMENEDGEKDVTSIETNLNYKYKSYFNCCN